MHDPLPYDLIAIDLDGTLLDSGGGLPDRNRAALHRAHERGLRIVVCTGRSFSETRDVLIQIGLDLDAAVTVFGAVITDLRSGRTTDRVTIPLGVAQEASGWLRALGYAVLWLVDVDEAGFDGYMIAGPRRHAAYDRWIQKSPCIIRHVDAVPAVPPEPVRITIIDDTPPLESVSRRIAAEFEGRLVHNVLRAPNYDLTVIEAFSPPVNKWYGIARLCERWGIDPARTLAIGDDVNDVEMLRRAGLGIAMGNARPAARAAAVRRTGTNDECGVAMVLDDLMKGTLR